MEQSVTFWTDPSNPDPGSWLGRSQRGSGVLGTQAENLKILNRSTISR